MLLRRIILYQKSYSQLSTRRSINSLATRMFRVILAFGGGIQTARHWDAPPEIFTRYSQTVRRLELVTALLRRVTRVAAGNYCFGSDGDHIYYGGAVG